MRNYYILLISIVFICGLILTSLGIFAFFKPQILAIYIIALFAFLVLSLKRESFLFVSFFFLLIFLLGIIRYNTFNIIGKNHIKNYVRHSEKTVLVQGKIIESPRESRGGKGATFILETDAIESEGNRRDASGLVLVNLYDRKDIFRYGDIVAIEGFLRQPFSYNKQSNFDYRKYLANKRIYSVLNVKNGFFAKKIGEDKKIATKFRRVIYSVQSKLISHIETYLAPPYSSMLTAILLGKRQKIPRALNNLFARTGTFHILAISGLHVGIIYFALRVILKIFSVQRNASIILSVLFLACFAILTGARPSILRATTMFSILAFGEILKRKISIFNLIGLSSFIVLMVNPNQVFDIGFMLSYTAALSIICISPIFYELFNITLSHRNLFHRFSHYLLTSVSVSLAAWLGLLPLVAYYFGLISPVVVAANLVVIPLLFMIMGSGILFLSLGFLSKFLAAVFSQSIWFFLFVLIKSIRFLKNIPLSCFEIRAPHLYSVILYYIILLSGLACLRFRKVLKNKLFCF